jgi:hypothetical protein
MQIRAQLHEERGVDRDNTLLATLAHDALTRQLGRALQRGQRATNPSNDLTTQPEQGQPRTKVKKPNGPAASSRPYGRRPDQIALTQPRMLRWWIEAERRLRVDERLIAIEGLQK